MNGTLLGFASLATALAAGWLGGVPATLCAALGALMILMRRGSPQVSDESLAGTDLYNLRTPTNFAPGGLPTFRSLPIPTTILVDARGVVRWIDQSTDHQVRSDPERLRAALDAVFA